MKLLKKFASLVLVILAVTSLTTSAFAAGGEVRYAGQAEKFIFAPGSKYSPTDLFTEFKNVMPGDVLTQTVNIRNDVKNNVKIKLYMRSLGAEPGSEEFLSKMDLTVDQVGSSNLFKAPADETAQLTDWVYLGTIYSGGNIDLDVSLNVSKELGNDFQEAIGYLDWEFMIEELPVEEDDPKPPKTGEDNLLGVFLPILSVSAAVLAALFFLIVLQKRRNGKETDAK